MTIKTFFAAVLLTGLAALPLQAQTNIAAEADFSLPAVVAAPEVDHQSNRSAEPFTAPRGVPGMEGLGMLGILVPLAPFAMPVFIVAVIFFFMHRRNQMVNETLRAMIDKGMPITPELVDSLKNKKRAPTDIQGSPRPRKDIRLGLILIGVGVGVVMLAGKPGWIVFGVGVAYLAIGLFERTPPNNPPPQPPQLPLQ